MDELMELDRPMTPKQYREFMELLDRSSIGPIDRTRTVRRSIHCGPCADDRCAEIGCTGVDCACVCLADKETLAGQVGDALIALGISASSDDADAVAESLYRKGWRRE